MNPYNVSVGRYTHAGSTRQKATINSWCNIFHLPTQSLQNIWKTNKDSKTIWDGSVPCWHSDTSDICCTFLPLLSHWYIYIYYLKKAPDPLRKRWCICIWIWHNHVSWMSPEVCGTVWDRTFHTVKSDMVKLIKGNDPSKCNLITCFEISYANANFNRLTP